MSKKNYKLKNLVNTVNQRKMKLIMRLLASDETRVSTYVKHFERSIERLPAERNPLLSEKIMSGLWLDVQVEIPIRNTHRSDELKGLSFFTAFASQIKIIERPGYFKFYGPCITLTPNVDSERIILDRRDIELLLVAIVELQASVPSNPGLQSLF